MDVLWVAVALIALAIDLVTSAFLFVSFTVGAVCALIAQTMKATAIVQFVVFIIVSGLSLVAVYTKGKKLLEKTVEKIPTPEERLIGRKIVLEEDVLDTATIKIDGIYRTVKTGEPLKKGDAVIIDGIDGNKLIIKKGE